MSILIIGAGEMGQALAKELSNANTVNLWDKNSLKINHKRSLLELTSEASAIFICIPSQAVSIVCKQIESHLKQNTHVICLSKGVEVASHLTMAEVLENNIPHKNWGLLYGAMLADEIENGKFYSGVISSFSEDTQKYVSNLFSECHAIIKPHNNPKATAWCGILKNIYAIGLGILDINTSSKNLKGFIIHHCLSEIRYIVKEITNDTSAYESYAGISDIVATGTSNDSHNYTYGLDIAKKKENNSQPEGALALQPVQTILREKNIAVPFFDFIFEVSCKAQNSEKSFENFLLKLKSS